MYDHQEPTKSRGFGFVTFADSQSMLYAIDGLDGKDVNGRNISVRKSSPLGTTPTLVGASKGKGAATAHLTFTHARPWTFNDLCDANPGQSCMHIAPISASHTINQHLGAHQ
jgi:RNA recognition motif-containing protein